jgi:hypothetical protein
MKDRGELFVNALEELIAAVALTTKALKECPVTDVKCLAEAKIRLAQAIVFTDLAKKPRTEGTEEHG